MQNYGILLVITPNIKSGCINDQFIYSWVYLQQDGERISVYKFSIQRF